MKVEANLSALPQFVILSLPKLTFVLGREPTMRSNSRSRSVSEDYRPRPARRLVVSGRRTGNVDI